MLSETYRNKFIEIKAVGLGEYTLDGGFYAVVDQCIIKVNGRTHFSTHEQAMEVAKKYVDNMIELD